MSKVKRTNAEIESGVGRGQNIQSGFVLFLCVRNCGKKFVRSGIGYINLNTQERDGSLNQVKTIIQGI